MPLKSIINSLDDVDEAHRPFYREDAGRHVLDVESVDGFALENVNGLKTALSAERRAHGDSEAQRREALARLDTFGDLDPDAARAALARVAAGPVDDVEKTVTARVEAMRASIAAAASTETTAARAEVDTLKGTLSKREAQLLKLTKDGAMRAELDRVRPIDDAVDALMLMAGQSVDMVEVDGELTARVVDKAGNPRLDAAGAPVSIRAFMKEMRDQRPSLFKPDDRKGMGTAGTGQPRAAASTTPDNPFAKGPGFNVTKQVAMQARDPCQGGPSQGGGGPMSETSAKSSKSSDRTKRPRRASGRYRDISRRLGAAG